MFGIFKSRERAAGIICIKVDARPTRESIRMSSSLIINSTLPGPRGAPRLVTLLFKNKEFRADFSPPLTFSGNRTYSIRLRRLFVNFPSSSNQTVEKYFLYAPISVSCVWTENRIVGAGQHHLLDIALLEPNQHAGVTSLLYNPSGGNLLSGGIYTGPARLEYLTLQLSQFPPDEDQTLPTSEISSGFAEILFEEHPQR